MTIVQQTDHVTTGLALLMEQFKNSPNLASFITAFLNEVQEIEDMLFDVKTSLTLDQATDAQLDILGGIVGQAREGRSDADYQIAIAAKIILNTAQATIEDLIAVARAIVGDKDVLITETFPAEVEVEVTEPIVNGAEAAVFVAKAIAAGVGGQFQWFEALSTQVFTFDKAGQGLDQGLLGEAIGF